MKYVIVPKYTRPAKAPTDVPDDGSFVLEDSSGDAATPVVPSPPLLDTVTNTPPPMLHSSSVEEEPSVTVSPVESHPRNACVVIDFQPFGPDPRSRRRRQSKGDQPLTTAVALETADQTVTPGGCGRVARRVFYC